MDFDSINEQVNNNLTINQVLGHYLEKKDNIRGNHKYTCPFHGDGKEKTPSLSASDSKCVWKCFGCNVGGGVIQFVQKYEDISYTEALMELNEVFDAGITWSSNAGMDKEYRYRKLIFDIHDMVNEKMVEYLHKYPEHYEYLKSARKLKDETIKKFEIGFSPKRDIEDLIKEIIKTDKYKEVKLKDTGLFSYNEDKKTLYFLFSDRIMYPIRNKRGRIVGWSGGRTYKEQEPKYINSVNNFIYNKSHILFNLDKVDFNINNSIVICEGNLDSTQIYNYGGTNAVSLLGTNLTQNQINLIKNRVNSVILALDADEAGSKATFKLSKLLLNNNIIPYIVSLGKNKDIDDFLKSNTQYDGNVDDFFEENKKEFFIEYLLETYSKNRDKFKFEQRYEILTAIKEVYENVDDDVLRNIYRNELEKHSIIFENLEKEKDELKRQKENTKVSVSIPQKDDFIKLLIYLIKDKELLSIDEVQAHNVILHSLILNKDEYNNYNKDEFYKKNKDLLLDFDEIEIKDILDQIKEF